MSRSKTKAKIKGVARVKKFNADQDETKEEPVEVHEQEFDLTEDQIKQVKKGKKLEIIDNQVIVKE